MITTGSPVVTLMPGEAESSTADVDMDYQVDIPELQAHPDIQNAMEHRVNVSPVTDTANTISSSAMVDFIKYSQKNADIQPRIYWHETSFYRIFQNARQKFCLGNRPEDLKDVATIEKRTWEKHITHLNRLERFPLDKAEYYLRLKESHGINSVRGLSKITGEDWSCIAKILRTWDLPGSIKDFLRNNKNNPGIIQFFHLRRLLDIVRQGEERLQLGRFRELMQEFENEANGFRV